MDTPGAAEVVPIVPIEDSTELSAEAISCLRYCSGAFIGGGDTRKYHKIYACTEVRAIIRELYQSGIPFGGVSAGVLISTKACTIWGAKLPPQQMSISLGLNRISIRQKMVMCS
ncbi:TPA: hypothetical protein DD712_04825 [Candidatus Acetothermia bacterium]|nr:hypothetical protein [Candidatus Acetothermia bacterium]